MNIGSLNKRIKLQSQVKAKNAMGGTTISWKDEVTVWGAIWPISANEAVRSGQLSGVITHRIRIRYRSDIKASWRGLHNDKYYNITSPPIDLNTAHKMLDILCKETETE